MSGRPRRSFCLVHRCTFFLLHCLILVLWCRSRSVSVSVHPGYTLSAVGITTDTGDTSPVCAGCSVTCQRCTALLFWHRWDLGLPKHTSKATHSRPKGASH